MRSTSLILFIIGTVSAVWSRQIDTVVIDRDIVSISPSFNRLLLGSNISWSDGGDGMFDPTTGNWRKPARALLDSLPLGSLRFPGGTLSESYEWALGIGSQKVRGWGKHLDGQSHRMVFGTDEFLSYCDVRNIEPVMTVGISNTSEISAAKWVEYCNGAPSTVEGSRRKSNGHAAPFDVRFWELGNEVYFTDSTLKAVREYARKANAMARSMKAVDPRIRLSANITGDIPAWDTEVISLLSPDIDVVSLHIYYLTKGSHLREIRDALLHVERTLLAGKTAVQLSRRRFDIAVTEFGVMPTDGRTFRNRPPDFFQVLFFAGSICIFARDSIAIATKWVAASPGNLYFADILRSHTPRPDTSPFYDFQKTFYPRMLENQIFAGKSGSGNVYLLVTSNGDGSSWNVLCVNLASSTQEVRIHAKNGTAELVEAIAMTDAGMLPRLDVSPDARGVFLPPYSTTSITYSIRP